MNQGVPGLGGRGSCLDDPDDLIYVLEGDEQSGQDVSPLLRCIQLEPGPPLDDYGAIVDVLLQGLLEGDCLGQAVNQNHVVDAVAGLKSSVLVQLIQDHMDIESTLDLHHQADAVLV